MSVYTWPLTGGPWAPQRISWRLMHNLRDSSSPLNGSSQSVGLPGARWACTITLPACRRAQGSSREAFLNRLGGGEHRLQLWDLLRERPAGTCNTTGVTASAASQFALSITLNGCGSAATLIEGDRIAVAIGSLSQLVQVAATATANGSGVMVVPITTMLRGAVSAGAAVTLIRPAALFKPADPEIVIEWGAAGIAQPMTLDWIEVFS